MKEQNLKEERRIGLKASKKRITLDLSNLQQTALVGKALSSEVRLEMLKLLIETFLFVFPFITFFMFLIVFLFAHL